MGLTVGIFTGPCIGPFVLGLLIYVGSTKSPLLGFVLFFVLALGLGIPIMVLAIASGLAKSIPRSGGWMEWVKRFFGVALIIMALYFLKPLIPETIYPWLLLVFVAAGGIYLGFIEKYGSEGKFRYAKYAVGILIIAAAALFFLPAKKGEAWSRYTSAALQDSIDKGKPAVLDFRADWCIPCVELEKKTFTDPQVKEELKRFATLKVDVTLKGSTEVEEVQKRFGVLGVPTVIFIGSDGKEITDLRLNKFEEAKGFLERLRKVK
jgi:thiol:disulfide interchange protein DsbD